MCKFEILTTETKTETETATTKHIFLTDIPFFFTQIDSVFMIKQNSVRNMSIEMSDALAFPMCDRLCSYVIWIEHAPHSIWDCYFVIKYIETHARKIVCHWFFNIINTSIQR